MRVTSALVCHVNIPSLENSVYETLSVKKALRKKGERWIFMDVDYLTGEHLRRLYGTLFLENKIPHSVSTLAKECTFLFYLLNRRFGAFFTQDQGPLVFSSAFKKG